MNTFQVRRLRILSDLHWECLRGREQAFALPPVAADVVVLAGDIATGTDGLVWARQAFPTTEIVYVAGNHEFYGHVWDQLLPELRRVARELQIHFLDADTAVIAGVRFLGATLWTDFALFGAETRPLAMRDAGRFLNDFTRIAIQHQAKGAVTPARLTPEQTVRWHTHARNWLTAMLAMPFPGPTVVVTHHAPHPDSVPVRYAQELTSAAFASDLSPLLGQTKLWVHGHMHDAVDFACQGTRVLANPRGYPRAMGGFENAAFDPGLVVEFEVAGGDD